MPVPGADERPSPRQSVFKPAFRIAASAAKVGEAVIVGVHDRRSHDDKRLLIKHYVSINESYLELLELATGTSTPLNPREGVQIGYGSAVFARRANGVYFVSDEDSGAASPR